MKKIRRLVCALSVVAATVSADADVEYSVRPLTGLPEGGVVVDALNNSTAMVGVYTPDGGYHYQGFVYQAGVLKNIGTLGGSGSRAFAINDAGRIAGGAEIPGGATHAFLYRDGRMTDLGTLGGPNSAAYGIDNRGRVVGQSLLSKDGGATRAFLYSDGKMVSLGTLGGELSIATDINDKGQIVGASTLDCACGQHAFLIDHGVMRDLGTLGGPTAMAQMINEAGDVVGVSDLPQSAGYLQHAFLFHDGVMRDISPIPTAYSRVTGLNNLGQAVGYSEGGLLSGQPSYLYSDGVSRNLDDLIDPAGGWQIMRAAGINDRKEIVADGCRADATGWFRCQTVLLTPVPEPSPVALLLCGSAVLAWRLRRPR
jgi:probable HAF family extracellular repeat protein